MRWLLLTDGLSPFEMGGMQKHSANLLKQLVSRGHFVSVAHCVTNHKPIDSTQVMAEIGIADFQNCEITQFTFPKVSRLPGHYIKESYLYSAKLFQYYQTHHKEWDVVFAQGFTGWKFIEERKKGNWKVPVVNHFHGFEMFQTVSGWKNLLKQYLFKSPVKWNVLHADATVSLGGRITGIIEQLGVDSRQIIHLPVAIDDNWFSSDKKTATANVRALFVGRFESRKGLGTLLSVFEKLDNPSAQLTLTIVGNIPYSQRKSVANVHYHGAIQNEMEMMQVMDEHDVLIVPSIAEGMPTVILEAMARGLAIWCTPVGANEVMVNGDNGYVFGSVEQLQILDGLKHLLHLQKHQITDMGGYGKVKCSNNWRWVLVMNPFMEMVEQIVARKYVR
jgi:glycosyltransferase involved in cell wall biosynthesis